MIVNINNKYFIESYKFIKDYYKNRIPKKTYKELFNNLLIDSNYLIENNKLNVSSLNLTEHFFNRNSSIIIDNKYLLEIDTAKILDYVNKYKDHERTKDIQQPEDKETGYTGIETIEKYNKRVKKEEHKYDENEPAVIPNNKHNIYDFKKNKALNPDLKYLFNHTLNITSINKNEEELQTTKIKIISEGSPVEYPLTYKITCHTCQRIARTTEIGFTRPTGFFCNSTVENAGGFLIDDSHRIINAKETSEPDKILYLIPYEIEILDEELNKFKETSLVLYSEYIIEEEIITAQVIKSSIRNSKKSNSFLILLSYITPVTENKIDRIIIKDKKKHKTAENNIYENLKDYLLKHHRKEINDNNKILALYIVLTLLFKFKTDTKLCLLIIGETGFGKTFLGEILPKLFTNRTKTLDGECVSKNIFLGGDGSVITLDGRRNKVKGAVGIYNFILLEEATNKLDDFINDNSLAERNNNVFSMLKKVSDGKVPVTTQGTNEYYTTASILLTGNLENMNSYHDYFKKVSKEYITLSNKAKYDISWPLFRPIEYYSTILNNPTLAKAHYNIRTGKSTNNSIPKNSHYITRLPSAELSRFHCLLVIEDNIKREQYTTLEDTQYFGNIHRDQILEEIGIKKELIDDINNTPKGRKLVNDCIRWMNEVFLKENNNFDIKDDGFVSVVRIRKNIIMFFVNYVLLQKDFYKEELVLTEEDKQNFKDIIAYNFNCFSSLEANTKTKPILNTYNLDKEKVINENINIEIREEVEKNKLNKSGEEFSFEEDLFNDLNNLK
jgi:hypothetical protein